MLKETLEVLLQVGMCEFQVGLQAVLKRLRLDRRKEVVVSNYLVLVE